MRTALLVSSILVLAAGCAASDPGSTGFVLGDVGGEGKADTLQGSEFSIEFTDEVVVLEAGKDFSGSYSMRRDGDRVTLQAPRLVSVPEEQQGLRFSVSETFGSERRLALFIEGEGGELFPLEFRGTNAYNAFDWVELHPNRGVSAFQAGNFTGEDIRFTYDPESPLLIVPLTTSQFGAFNNDYNFTLSVEDVSIPVVETTRAE